VDGIKKSHGQRISEVGGGNDMEKYIHRENLALLRKRLAETRDEARRKVLLKLLAEEEAKDFGPPRKQK
jgi:hypothetical protein